MRPVWGWIGAHLATGRGKIVWRGGRKDCDSGTGSTLGCFLFFLLFLLFFFFFFFFLFLLRFQILLHCVCVIRTMGVVDQPILNESIWIEVEWTESRLVEY
ncbi:hypothetical protein BO83DRAFT_62078 [Aspergillus eucalypticola CBS 122712]|uniref:Uncharacterized protein n=1 Tax=Aspergillus eucalypticola (strain CBS 122712 / IBT 29274) TaxID=1448314 RepID=A0A317V752_ASPEC|nr:uncharacterized protein BO83DRAFT_62078 [Aspergillus eucalypticola CBS 122712]PWY69926.1 hypothetical protein BO83DRAFT_62078 [Aspergillus eucalypticola CBS 122712]